MVLIALIVLLSMSTQAASAAQARRPTALEVQVTDRTGTPIEDARVMAEGPVGREGQTTSDGSVTFRNLAPGVYRFRVEREGFITLEKEVTVRAGTAAAVEAALSVAPAPPTPPQPVAPPPEPVAAVLPGESRVISIPDLAEDEFISREPVKESPIGCSGVAAARLVQVRDPLSARSHADADEMLYVVAGDATLRLGDKAQPVTPGWFSIVPRGSEYSLTRRGRNPVILLSVLAGQPCSGSPSRSDR